MVRGKSQSTQLATQGYCQGAYLNPPGTRLNSTSLLKVTFYSALHLQSLHPMGTDAPAFSKAVAMRQVNSEGCSSKPGQTMLWEDHVATRSTFFDCLLVLLPNREGRVCRYIDRALVHVRYARDCPHKGEFH